MRSLCVGRGSAEGIVEVVCEGVDALAIVMSSRLSKLALFLKVQQTANLLVQKSSVLRLPAKEHKQGP